MLCRAATLKVSPYIIYRVDNISLLVLEISEDIFGNQKISFSYQHIIYLAPFLVDTSLCNHYRVESCKITVNVFGSMLSNLRIILFFVLTTLMKVATLQLHLSLASC